MLPSLPAPLVSIATWRRLSVCLWAVVCGVSVVGCGGIIRFGELDPPPGELTVVDIDVEGNDVVSESDLVGQLETYTDWAVFEDTIPLLDRNVLPDDSQRIETLYGLRGFFEARVTDIRIEARSEDSVQVVFVVDEGEPTLVSEIDYVGLDREEVAVDSEAGQRLLEVAEELPSLTELAPGDRWIEAAHERTESAIENALYERGFHRARVYGQAYVDRVAHRTRLVYQIDHGPLIRVGQMRVEGNTEIPGERILRRVHMEPGDIAEPDELERIEEQVFDLGNFYYVRVRLGDNIPTHTGDDLDKLIDFGGDDDDLASAVAVGNAPPRVWDETVELIVDVQELPEHELTGGVGATIGNVRSDVHLAGGYENLNFLGGLRKLDFQVRPQYVFLPTIYDPQVSGPGGRTDLTFRQPSFFEEYLELSVTTLYELEVDYGFNQHHVAAQPRLSRKFLRYLTAYVGYNVDYYSYFQISDTFEAPARELLGFAFRDQYLISSLEQGLTLDIRDDPLDPRNGFYLGGSVLEALTALGSDFEYYSVSGDMRGYATFWEPLTVAARIKVGRIFTQTPGDEVPLAARFRGGGANEMRGFGFNRMGPSICVREGATSGEVLRDGVECAGGIEEQIFVGGNVLMLGSLETRWRLPFGLVGYPLSLVGFIDVGEIFDTQDEVAFDELHVAAGPGLRWLTPIGPVRFDVGILLTGPVAPRPEFHFSIGQAF